MASTIYRKIANFYRKQKERVSNFRKTHQLHIPDYTVSMTLDEDDVQIAEQWLNTPTTAWFSHEMVEQYHRAFAEWNGSARAFSFMSGREALSACIFALDLQAGDAVIVPAYTCVVVPNAFYFAGIEVIFCDIELDTYGIDITKLVGKITSQTKAIVLQHLYGMVCRDYEEIIALAKQYGLLVIEDCTHSTGATYKNIKIGNYGDVAFYSSECSKVFNTIQGGLAISNQPKYIEKLATYYDSLPFADSTWIKKQLSNVPYHYYTYKYPIKLFYNDWAQWRYGDDFLVSTTQEEKEGRRPAYYGRKMAAPIANLGLNQLLKIDFYNSQRITQATVWADWCHTHHYLTPTIIPNSSPIFLRYPILVEPEKKRNLDWAIREFNFRPGVWFTSHIHPVEVQPMVDCKNAITAVKQCINLPTLINK